MGTGWSYQSDTPIVLVGSKSGTTRTSVALTDSYDVANKTKIIETGGIAKINLSILYTTGATETDNSVQIRVEFSSDGTNFYRAVNDSTSGATSTLTQREFTFVGAVAATAYGITLPLDVYDRFMRFSFNESGVVTNAGTIYAEATLSGEK